MVKDIRVISLLDWPKNYIPSAIDQFSMISVSKNSFQKSCKIEHFSKHKCFFEFFKFVLKKVFYLFPLLSCILKKYFENYLSENLIIRNWIMSVGIRLIVFVIQLSLEFGIRFYRSTFLVGDLDEYYHLKVVNVYFWEQTSELKEFEVGQNIIISQLPFTNFRWFHFLKNSFHNLTQNIFFPQTRFYQKNRNLFKK